MLILSFNETMINWGENYDAIPESMGLSLTVAKSTIRHQKIVLDFNLLGRGIVLYWII